MSALKVIAPRGAQTGESWNRCVRPKATGAWHLHELTKALPEVEQFVLFSSIVSWVGHQGALPLPARRASLLPACGLARLGRVLPSVVTCSYWWPAYNHPAQLSVHAFTSRVIACKTLFMHLRPSRAQQGSNRKQECADRRAQASPTMRMPMAQWTSWWSCGARCSCPACPCSGGPLQTWALSPRSCRRGPSSCNDGWPSTNLSPTGLAFPCSLRPACKHCALNDSALNNSADSSGNEACVRGACHTCMPLL